jgi:exopolysaccharide biosynthesis polyprenyl glycosylphosphotransferase
MGRLLLLADFVGLSAAYVLTQVLLPDNGELTLSEETALFLLTLPLWLILATAYGLYARDTERTDHQTADDLVAVFHLVTVGVWILFLGTVLTRATQTFVPKLALFWLGAIVLVTLARAIARAVGRRNAAFVQNTVIVGNDSAAWALASKLAQHPEYGAHVVALVGGELSRPGAKGVDHVEVLDGPKHLANYARKIPLGRVIVTSEYLRHEPEVLDILRELDVQIDLIPPRFDALGPRLKSHSLQGLPLLSVTPSKPTRSAWSVKRGVDVVVSSLALVALVLPFVLIALCIQIDSRGPAFYRHDRVGLRGRPLRLWKFRTMHAAWCRGPRYGGQMAEDEFARLMQSDDYRSAFEREYKLKDDPRVTRFGRVLRRTSIDELPQLFNVLVGDMSLVGPRPVTHEELDRYGHGLDSILSVRPGMTGFWQVNGRSALDYSERIRLDRAYVASWSLQLDAEILAKTVAVVASRRHAA